MRTMARHRSSVNFPVPGAREFYWTARNVPVVIAGASVLLLATNFPNPNQFVIPSGFEARIDSVTVAVNQPFKWQGFGPGVVFFNIGLNTGNAQSVPFTMPNIAGLDGIVVFPQVAASASVSLRCRTRISATSDQRLDVRVNNLTTLTFGADVFSCIVKGWVWPMGIQRAAA